MIPPDVLPSSFTVERTEVASALDGNLELFISYYLYTILTREFRVYQGEQTGNVWFSVHLHPFDLIIGDSEVFVDVRVERTIMSVDWSDLVIPS